MPSTEPNPRPWRVEESICGWKSCVSDANGKPVASCWGGGPTEQQEKAEANAAIIVAAVNKHGMPIVELIKAYDALEAERDRLRAELTRKAKNYEDVIAFHKRTEAGLRDLVKRMLPFVEKCHSDALGLSKTIKGICALKGVDTSEIDRINSEHDALIAEARAAIGEDAK